MKPTRIIAPLLLLLGVLPDLRAEIASTEELFRTAVQLDRPILLVFSGSDWCVPCIRFDRQVLSQQTFIDFAEENLIFLKADFPQRLELSETIVARNTDLAERYNPEGEFPRILLLDNHGTELAVLPYHNQSAEAFLSELRQAISDNLVGNSDRDRDDDDRTVSRSGAEGGETSYNGNDRGERVDPDVAAKREYRRSEILMGCGFDFTIVDTDSLHARRMLEECVQEVRRIEGLLSEWIDTSETSRVNAAAGSTPVAVDQELYKLLERCLEISRMTQGAFDVSFAGLGDLWKFDGTQRTLPDSASVRGALAAVGYRNIRLLDSSRVFLPKAGMKIGFGSIGKGYAAERVRSMMVSNGIAAGVINASGDLTAWGKRPDGTPWKVGIADPEHPDDVLLWLPIENGAVATSGNYRKFFEIDGVRYAHILDPRTGYPTQGIRSVTVMTNHAELSDALATAVFVLGIDVGIDLIDQLPDAACIIVDDRNGLHYSKRLHHL